MQEFQQKERDILLKTAHDTIQFCLNNPLNKMPTHLNEYPEQLRLQRACFVTLHLNGQLRGCIGSLQAHQALILDVIQNSYSAAFRDPRFAPLTAEEIPLISLEISVLTTPRRMQFNSEADLLQQILPGADGLILSDAGHRGTFLPSVWQQLPEKQAFLQHLKIKAGLPTNYWSNSITVERYTTELIS